MVRAALRRTVRRSSTTTASISRRSHPAAACESAVGSTSHWSMPTAARSSGSSTSGAAVCPPTRHDLEAVRLAVLRLSRWMGDDPLRVVWTDLVRGNQRETVVDASTIEELRPWFDERVELVRQSIARPDAVNGADCGQCNFVAGCPQHGSWHGRARGQRNDFRPPILRLSPSTSLASWHRCRARVAQHAPRDSLERRAGADPLRRRDARAPEARAPGGFLPGRRARRRRPASPRRRRQRADSCRSRPTCRALPSGRGRARTRNDTRPLPVPSGAAVHGERTHRRALEVRRCPRRPRLQDRTRLGSPLE